MGWTLDDSANNCQWRVGRKLGRTIYAQHGDDPSVDDEFLGLMETEAIADMVVSDHNGLPEPAQIDGTVRAPEQG